MSAYAFSLYARERSRKPAQTAIFEGLRTYDRAHGAALPVVRKSGTQSASLRPEIRRRPGRDARRLLATTDSHGRLVPAPLPDARRGRPAAGLEWMRRSGPEAGAPPPEPA
jgi:hypothetical protein